MSKEQNQDIEVQRIELERDRLKLERQSLVFRYAAILGAIFTFAWTAFTYFHTAGKEREKALIEQARESDKQSIERKREADVRKVAALEPFLKLQLKLFEETALIVSSLASSIDPEDRPKKIARFWQLYHGELALVEHGKVAGAMFDFGEALNTVKDPKDLERYSLAVAHACRDELAESWDEPSWRFTR
jgi:hypothetical protein